MSSYQFQVGSVLLVDVLKERRGRLFELPKHVISCTDLDQVGDALAEVEAARAGGAHVAGFLAYELGYAFEEKLAARWQKTGDPLLWFGVFPAPRELSLAETRALLAESAAGACAMVSEPTFDMSRADYGKAFERVQRHLAEGDIYQVNLTLRARFSHVGPPEALFLDLLERQPVAHAAFLKLDDRSILSLSPELFLERQGNVIRSRPMKGTAGRGRDLAGDQKIAQSLAADPKQRAENIMIVDLMRNDLSRVSHAGSVLVTDLCQVERYKSLHQMTSTVEAVLEPHVEFPDIIARLFPCGSITGAPKLRAMQIADSLETSPRGVYTGAIGCLEPSGDFRFNVAIRTLVLRKDGDGEVGTGSGVVFDSGASPEYDECTLKLRFLNDDADRFGLFETLAFDPDDGYLLLDRHLERLARSAAYFGFPCDLDRVTALLETASNEFNGAMRVRVDLDRFGEVTLSSTPLAQPADPQAWIVALVPEPVHSEDRFLYHKTTKRSFYDQTRARYAALFGCREVLFENEHGYLTEGSFTNLFLRKNGRLLTPALKHGLLPGTLRSALLEQRRAFEADLVPADLKTAEAVFLGNSVRGLIRADVMKLAALKAVS